MGARGFGRSGGLRVVCLAAVLTVLSLAPLLLVLPPSLSGQEVSLGRAEAEYGRALAAYRELKEERDRALSEHDVLIDRLEAVRRSGDPEREEEAKRRVFHQGFMTMDLDRHLGTAAEALSEAGRVLLAAVSAREDRLLDELEVAGDRFTIERLQAELVTLRQRHREVQEEVGDDLFTTADFVPQVRVRATDGPRELHQKADMVERRVVELDTLIVDIDRDIASSERRLQQQRGGADFLDNLSRFGDDRIVGGTSTIVRSDPGDEGGPGSSGTFVDLEALPLAERVVWLRAYREQVVVARDESLELAGRFRELAGNPGPPRS